MDATITDADKLAAALQLSRHGNWSGDCWLWTGADTGRGYGHIRFRGRDWIAHRLSWLVWRGPLPRGLLVCHTCDNRRCINPDHFFLGTHKDNMRDAMRKNRLATGLRNTQTKLSTRDKQQIRAMHATHKQVQIAVRFGISQSRVSQIINRKLEHDQKC